MNDLVREKVYANGLRVLKYKPVVFWDNLWTDELVKYRGMVKDAEGNIVSYPFDKVFNYKENNTLCPHNELVLAVEKVNGFLAVVSVYNNELLVSTTGTLDSEYAALAKDVVLKHGLTVNDVRGYTMMFEVCHRSDPHIIQEEHELYFIGARDMQNMKMLTPEKLPLLLHNIPTPKHKHLLFSDILELQQTEKIEGWMIYYTGGVLKIKTKFYLITKFLGRNKKYINKLWDRDLKPNVDEEYYPLLDFIKINYDKNYWLSLKEKAKVDIITQYLRNN